MKLKLNKYGKKMQHDLYRNCSPGQIQCTFCHRYMSPHTLYEKGQFFLHGRDFCPECREPFYISPYKAAMLNKVIAEDIEADKRELSLAGQKESFLPVREEANEEDWRNIPDAY